MADKLAGIINYLIGAVAMTYMLFVIKRKSVAQPQTKIAGLSAKTITNLIYAGIIIDLCLIIVILIG
jgi:hypothetical protein